MAGSSSSSDLFHIVDEFYFSALHDDDEIFPISDEKYANNSNSKRPSSPLHQPHYSLHHHLHLLLPNISQLRRRKRK
ncbi:hypothetical protein OSB04_005105 [Centaurea solstitialis]|uniref:Uncharacterized protein n=1 Tax=Centaurea solstitialis TaxID=347529 RepID=A0AA38TS03_9ASTR|nr:hypothetical protein OSB04_005105 [Centaurea solstitialis]